MVNDEDLSQRLLSYEELVHVLIETTVLLDRAVSAAEKAREDFKQLDDALAHLHSVPAIGCSLCGQLIIKPRREQQYCSDACRYKMANGKR